MRVALRAAKFRDRIFKSNALTVMLAEPLSGGILIGEDLQVIGIANGLAGVGIDPDPSCVVLNTNEQLDHLIEAKPACIVLGEGMTLACGDLMLLGLVFLCVECAHVLDEFARDRGR
jgi:hypothetical protein